MVRSIGRTEYSESLSGYQWLTVLWYRRKATHEAGNTETLPQGIETEIAQTLTYGKSSRI